MSSDKLIANELLAFIQHAIDTMDEISILQVCKSNFKEEEICSAKMLLYETLDKMDQMPTRRRDERGERSLQDIINLLKKTDPDNVPTFVAKQLHKLPPVTFDHVDVTRLLKDITTLKASLAEVKFRLEISETTIGELRTELLSIKRNDSTSRSPAETSNINSCRGAQNASVCSFPSPPAAVTVCAAPRPAAPARSPRVTSATTNTSPLAYAAVAATAPPVPQQRPSLTRKKQPCKRLSAPASHSDVRQQNYINKNDKVDQHGFTLVEKRKRRPRPSRNQRGTAPAAATSVQLRVAEPTMAIYLSRFHQSTTGEEVIRYIKEKSRDKHNCQNISFELARLESSRTTTTFKSYVLQFPAKHKMMFLAADFWPEGIVYRRYREARPKKNP